MGVGSVWFWGRVAGQGRGEDEKPPCPDMLKVFLALYVHRMGKFAPHACLSAAELPRDFYLFLISCLSLFVNLILVPVLPFQTHLFLHPSLLPLLIHYSAHS